MMADKETLCVACGRIEAIMSCDHCGKPLYRVCRKFELWGSGAEDLSAKYFCPRCTDNPDVNPWGARDDDPGLSQTLEVASRDQERYTAQAV